MFSFGRPKYGKNPVIYSNKIQTFYQYINTRHCITSKKMSNGKNGSKVSVKHTELVNFLDFCDFLIQYPSNSLSPMTRFLKRKKYYFNTTVFFFSLPFEVLY